MSEKYNIVYAIDKENQTIRLFREPFVKQGDVFYFSKIPKFDYLTLENGLSVSFPSNILYTKDFFDTGFHGSSIKEFISSSETFKSAKENLNGIDNVIDWLNVIYLHSAACISDLTKCINAYSQTAVYNATEILEVKYVLCHSIDSTLQLSYFILDASMLDNRPYNFDKTYFYIDDDLLVILKSLNSDFKKFIKIDLANIELLDKNHKLLNCNKPWLEIFDLTWKAIVTNYKESSPITIHSKDKCILEFEKRFTDNHANLRNCISIKQETSHE